MNDRGPRRCALGGVAMALAGAVGCRPASRPVPEPPSPVVTVPPLATRVARTLVASMPARARPVGSFPDGDVLVLDEDVPGLRRQRPDGGLVWTAAWSGELSLDGNHAGEHDIWIVGRAEGRLRISSSVAFEPVAGDVERPLLLARLDATTGEVLAARFITDASYASATLKPAGTDVIVVAKPASDAEVSTFHVRRHRPDLTVSAEVVGEATWVPMLQVGEDRVCIGSERGRRRPDVDTRTREVWCLDGSLRGGTRRSMGLDLEILWMRGDRIVAELVSPGSPRFELRIAGRPPLAITGRCAEPGDHAADPALTRCPRRAVTAPDGVLGGAHDHVFLVTEVPLDLAGTEIPVSSPTAVLVDFDREGRLRYSAHPGCDAVTPVEHERAALRCGARFDIVSLAP